MSSFKYFRPSGAHHKVSIRDWNRTFSVRGRYPFTVANVYLGRDTAIVHFNVSLVGKALFWLLSPIYYPVASFVYGFSDAHDDFKRVVFDKSKGSYGVEAVYRRHTYSWLKLMSLIGRDKY